MSIEDVITEAVKKFFDAIITLLLGSGQNPREVLPQLLDEHPEIQKMDDDVQKAIDEKFGP